MSQTETPSNTPSTDDPRRALFADVAAKLDAIAVLCHELGQPNDGDRGGQIFTIGLGIEAQRDRLEAIGGAS